MPTPPPSAPLRALLRERVLSRIFELKLKDIEAAEQLGLSAGQMSRLRQSDGFTQHTERAPGALEPTCTAKLL